MPRSAFEFRPMTREDLPMVLAWHDAPHARRFFGRGKTFEEITEEYLPYIRGEIPIYPYVALHDGQPIGMMSWERLGDFPEVQEAYGVTDPDASNCDVLLGESSAVHRGLGARMIEAFLERIVFADPRITSCVIDPETENFIAIRAYEKAGFRFVRAAADDLDGASVYLMELRREELGAPRAPIPYLRPARPDEVELAIAIDEDACTAYTDAGLVDELADDDPFNLAEAALWAEAARAGRMLFACSPEGEPVGFIALGFIDGRPHLEQISVRRAWMRRGIGRLLLDRAKHWSVRPAELWITTYDAFIPWNEPWYARAGFTRVAPADLGPELRATLEAEGRALPEPEHRIAMVYRHPRERWHR